MAEKGTLVQVDHDESATKTPSNEDRVDIFLDLGVGHTESRFAHRLKVSQDGHVSGLCG